MKTEMYAYRMFLLQQILADFTQHDDGVREYQLTAERWPGIDPEILQEAWQEIREACSNWSLYNEDTITFFKPSFNQLAQSILALFND